MSHRLLKNIREGLEDFRKGEYVLHGPGLSVISDISDRMRLQDPLQKLILTIEKKASERVLYTLSWGTCVQLSGTPFEKAGSKRPRTSPSPKSRRPKTTASRGKKRGD
jgi:hypothetical protein